MLTARVEPTNRLLVALQKVARPTLFDHLEFVELEQNQVLVRSGECPTHAYFPLDSVLTALILGRGGTSTGTSIIGNEGMLGVSAVLNADALLDRVQVLCGGSALRLPIRILKGECGSDGPAQRLLLMYVQVLIDQASATVACFRYHSVEQRLRRMLLMCLDRLQSCTLPLTQELIANVLGVRREGVTEAVSRLQSEKHIASRRGRIVVLNRAGLESGCCECYAIINTQSWQAFERSDSLHGMIDHSPALAPADAHSNRVITEAAAGVSQAL